MAETDIPIPPPPDTTEAKFEAAFVALKARCATGRIEVTAEANLIAGGNIRPVHLLMPNGREKRRVSLFSIRAIERLMPEPFHKVSFLGDYEAICDYEGDYVEGYIRSSRPAGLVSGVGPNFFGKNPDGTQKTSLELSSQRPQTNQRITIGPMSPILKALLPYMETRERFATSIKLIGFGITTHDQALSLLERAALSVFMQIDLQYGVTLLLVRSAANVSRFPFRRLREAAPIAFPTAEYDKEPTMLYFYGRSASGLPLLQFLAFYQVLEFYFPKFSQVEARRRATAILKTPGFDCHREADVVRLVATLSRYSGKGYGEERAQLRATLMEIIGEDDLRAFYLQTEEIKEFFAKAKETTGVKIPLSGPEQDLCGITAERIYDIRCKIVHSKADSEVEEYILPFSRQASQLQYDVALVSMLAQKALIHGCTGFKGAAL